MSVLETLQQNGERLELIRHTELGQTLIERPRYGLFRPEDMSVDEWFKLLDADVNNFDHNGLTAILAYMVTTKDGASEELTRDMILTATLHDLPEDVTGSAIGDKQYNISGAEDEKREHSRLLELAADPDFPLTVQEVERGIAILRDSKLKPPTTVEGWTFNIIERVGYIRTALIAWEATWSTAVQEHQRANLLWVVGNILGNHLSYLERQRSKSCAVDELLVQAGGVLDEMSDILTLPAIKTGIWNICDSTYRDGHLDPDWQLKNIIDACDYWQQAA